MKPEEFQLYCPRCSKGPGDLQNFKLKDPETVTNPKKAVIVCQTCGFEKSYPR